MFCYQRNESSKVRELLNCAWITNWQSLNASAYATRVCTGCSRFLLILAAVEFITMPLTQHIWTWDHFLHGGQDFESSLLVIVISVCLPLLLAQHRRQDTNRLLALLQLLGFILRRHRSARHSRGRRSPVHFAKRRVDPALSMTHFPLQI